MGSLTRTVADLQELPETEPISMYYEFGLARCTKTCRESCGFTCGPASCTHTVGVVAQKEGGVSEEAVLKAQAEGGKWE
jgi:hypothetical protein